MLRPLSKIMQNYKAKISEINHNISPHSGAKRFFKFLLIFLSFSGAILLAFNLVAGRIAKEIPPRVEQELFSKFDFEKKENIKDEFDENYKPKYQLRDLVKKLDSHVPKTRDSYKIEANLQCVKAANAFAMFGGKILVTSGLFDLVKSENGLAFVIAHELGHVYLRHNSKQMISGLLATTFASFLGIEDAQKYFMSLTEVAHLKFGRDAERQADEFALDLVTKEYGHVAGADELFLGLQKQNNSQLELYEKFPILSSHPATKDRIDFIRSHIHGNNLKLNDLAIDRLAIPKYCESEGHL